MTASDACFAMLVIVLAAQGALAQDAKSNRLIDQPPFDVLTLDKANDNKVLKVQPLNLPGRRVPENPKRTDKLKVKLLDDGQEYEVAWGAIDKLELFEQLVLAEANRLTAEGKFDEAYDDFAFLLNFYPGMTGLKEARESYLYLSAGAAFRQRKLEEALAVLEELLARNPQYRGGANAPTLLQVLGNIADPLVAGYIEREEYRAARVLLTRLAKQYKAENEPFFQRGKQRLTELATGHRAQAQQHLQAGRLMEAHVAGQAMLSIWPDLPGAAELLAEIGRRHPLLTVGVEHPALAFGSRSLHNVAARRAGRLTERLLAEYSGPGPEGGQYDCPLGTLGQSEDGLVLTFRLHAAAGVTAPELTQRLFSLANRSERDYQLVWGRIVSKVRTEGTSEVRVELRWPHVLPAALLQIQIAKATDGVVSPLLTPYEVLSHDESATRFTIHRNYALRGQAQPAEIVERQYGDPQRALLALQRGEIDILDRVFPGDIAALKSNDRLVVAPYRAPTTHVLVIRSQNPFLANRNFRRALLYGCNRELLLKQGLLRGQAPAGFRVVSSPFPAAYASGDAPAYGYDQQIPPRPYDPRLAFTLRLVAEGEIKGTHEKQKQPAPKLAPLVLGHPADETSRIACRGLLQQWKEIGIECKLEEFPPGVFLDAAGKCDLVYLQLAAWEPLVDAARLLGPEGLAPVTVPVIQLTLRQIGEARNWQQARERLLQLHRHLHEEVSLVPLWQTMDHFAYRRTLEGLRQPRVSLYQDVEQWQAAAQLAGTIP